MYGYVYITYNKINGKIYIGQRKGQYDETYLGSGKYLKNAIRKYGKENFENYIIEWCETYQDLNEREIYWIAKYNCTSKNNFGYNIAAGGTKNLFEYMSQEDRKEFGRKMKMMHANMSYETRVLRGRKISLSLKGRKLSSETRNKISLCQKGKILSPETRRKMSESRTGELHPMYKKSHTEESLKKMSEVQKSRKREKTRYVATKRPHSEETKKKISEAAKAAYKNNVELLERLKKKVTVIFKEKEYNFNSRTECEQWFLENMNINVYYWMRGKVQARYKDDVQFIKVGDKIKVNNL